MFFDHQILILINSTSFSIYCCLHRHSSSSSVFLLLFFSTQVVVLCPETLAIKDVRNFNTLDDMHAAALLTSYIASIPFKHHVLCACRTDCTSQMSQSAVFALQSIGAKSFKPGRRNLFFCFKFPPIQILILSSLHISSPFFSFSAFFFFSFFIIFTHVNNQGFGGSWAMIGSKGGQREGCRQNCRTRMAGAAAIMGTLVAEAGTAVGSDRSSSSSGGGGVNVVDIGMKEHDMKNYDDDENGSGGGGGIIANAAAASADRRRMEREKRRNDRRYK